MKAVTANRLADGRVVYLAPDGAWTERLVNAAIFENIEAENALASLGASAIEFADAYLIEVHTDGYPSGREALRETIRNSGPTIRTDLGKQAENG